MRRSSATSSSSSLVDADGEPVALQPRREPRPVPARHRRLRPVRLRLLGHAAPGAAAQARARRRAARRPSGSCDAFDERIADGLPLRRLPVRDRPALGRLPATRRVLVLPARSPTDADARRAARALRGRLGRAAPARAHRQEPAFDRYPRTTSRPPGSSTGPTRTSSRFYLDGLSPHLDAARLRRAAR